MWGIKNYNQKGIKLLVGEGVKHLLKKKKKKGTLPLPSLPTVKQMSLGTEGERKP